MTVAEREDRLQELRERYSHSLTSAIAILQTDGVQLNVQQAANELNQAGINFFNQFERTIDEYGAEGLIPTPDTITRKTEDAINLIKTIVTHWQIVQRLVNRFTLIPISPSTTSYASLQRLLKTTRRREVQTFRQIFIDANLPTYGFDQPGKHSGWEPKMNTKKIGLAIVSGLAALAMLGFTWKTPLVADTQRIQLLFGISFVTIAGYMIFLPEKLAGMKFLMPRLLLSFGLSCMMVPLLPGNLTVNWSPSEKFAVTAGGAAGFFLLIYFLNPPTAKNLEG